MAGRFLSLFKVFRRKKEKGPGAAPGKQPEEPKHLQPLQEDAAQDKTREQEPGPGCFRKTLKRFRKFLRIRRRKTGTTAAEGRAQPESGLTELQAEPDVSPDSAERSQDSDTSVTESWEKALLTSMTEDVAITNTDHGETQGIANTDTKPDLAECSEDTEAAMNEDRAKADMALTDDVANSGETQGIANTDTKPDSAERSEDSEAEMNSSDHRAKDDMAVTEDVITSANTGETQGITDTDTMPAPTVIHVPTKDSFEESSVPSQQQVPAIVRNIHQRLVSHGTVVARLKSDIVRLAEEHPVDVVLTLLRCAPTCDRAAAMIWRTIGSSGPAVEKVLPTLLCVMEDWPVHSACSSDGDDRDIFALAATLVIWVIMPECHEAMLLYSSRLFVALLFHVVITTQQMPPEEVDTFWRDCREEHYVPNKPNRSQSAWPSHALVAMQAMKALLYRLSCDNEVMSIERKCGWDTLLCAHTQHYAVGLLARKMRPVSLSLCSGIALRLLGLLGREEPHWDLPALAFLVEFLECLDWSEAADSTLEIMSRYLQSECRERRRLALRSLVVLSKDPLMAKRICSVSQSLLELLSDTDGEVVRMTLSVLTNLLKNNDILVSDTTAPKLAEALLLLFDHDNSHVQLLSLNLFFKVMDLVVDEGKKPLKSIVCQSLPPLFFHCHDENQHVAEASRETLQCAAGFLKKRELKQLVETENLLTFAEVLLAEDRSRAAEHLRRALRYLESPQEPLREAAITFMGSAGVLLKGQPGDLQVICEALLALRRDDSPSQTNIVVQQIFSEKAAEVAQKSECFFKTSKCNGR
ncbi:maestro heat-like repeat-containing protein family member 6 [Molothrus ater]|uniref:maestro heat-like repeat-containing protein family member 6 n=1 Tax=Molothrus ater TaxID=84834 RepID=UPI00174AC4A2|nr:maestro heat-like repeat-containing protein family member 6 [Molothrus ater]